jgi:hypothetical protein
VFQRMWPEHPQLAGFFLTLITAIAVQVAWPHINFGAERDKS